MNRLEQFYDALMARYGPQHWWPVTPGTPAALAPWEIAAGAVLTQNTSWRNVETAIARLHEAGELTPERIRDLPHDELAELIRPTRYFNVKVGRLQALAGWWCEHRPHPRQGDRHQLRRSLLAVHGVGEETADSILLYALGHTNFMIDAYTRRVVIRHGLAEERVTYGELKALFEEALPHDHQLFNEYHALIVAVGQEHCKPTPQCEGCPLACFLD